MLRSVQSVVMLVLATVTLAACNETPKPMQMPPAAVSMEPVKLKTYREKSNYLATLKSHKSITLLANNIDGHITDIKVTAGQSVRKGETIMRIDSRMQTSQTAAGQEAAASVQSDLSTARATLASLQSTLRSRQANVEYTQAQYDRYQQLRKDGAVSQSDLDGWKNNHAAALADRDSVAQQIEAQKMTVQKFANSYKQALASLQVQKDLLNYYQIDAPFAGIVGDIPVKVGDHITSSTVLTTLTENHPLEVYVSIPAEKASDVHKGMHIALVSTDGKQYGDSEVIFIAPTVDSNSQTVLIKSLYPNAKSELRADQTVTAQIVWQERPGITVPTTAVTQAAGKYFVFIAKDDGKKGLMAHQAEIQVYEIVGNSYQVKSGVKPGDRVITSGIQRLGEGAPIVPKDAAALVAQPDAKSVSH